MNKSELAAFPSNVWGCVFLHLIFGSAFPRITMTRLTSEGQWLSLNLRGVCGSSDPSCSPLLTLLQLIRTHLPADVVLMSPWMDLGRGVRQ